jgi:hypothetical protein
LLGNPFLPPSYATNETLTANGGTVRQEITIDFLPFSLPSTYTPKIVTFDGASLLWDGGSSPQVVLLTTNTTLEGCPMSSRMF